MAAPLRFGPAGRFELQPAERRLLVDGRPVAVGGRALDVLITLAANPDHLLTKNELLERAWPGLVVEEANLQMQISHLRKLLGADVIHTVPGRGYRFAAPVEGAVSDRAAGAPAAPPSSAAQTNLPAELPALYGRDDDVSQVHELLAAHRLVSIIGAGGIGKTRVAQAAAWQLRGEFEQGVWLVELAPIADAALVASAVAQALSLQLRAQGLPLNELVAALQPQRVLLVLDNCEHLLEGVSLVAQALVTRTPKVRVLVTSQEPLRLPAEHQVRLGPLSVPGADRPLATAEAWLQFGAVRLFVERVRALDPRFDPDAAQAVAVADICRQLDGLALAIELAAARVPLLGVQGVRARLGERLRVLTGGSRIALRRHQTLRAALDWSHGLLSAQEGAVFRRLAVFSGGCTIEAVQHVAADAQLDAWAVLDHVSALVDKSLVVADGSGHPRYRMLESSRAYALEKLAEAQESDLLARRHAEFYAAFFQRIADALYAGSTTEDAFIGARALELDNFRAAMGWALGESGDVECATSLLANVGPMSYLLPSAEECAGWSRRLDQRAAGVAWLPAMTALRAYVRISFDWTRTRLGAMPTEPLPAPSALRALGDAARQAHAAMLLALWETYAGGHPDVIGAALAEYDQLEPAGLPAWLSGHRLFVETRIAHLEGRVPDLRRPLEHTLERLRAAGNGDGRVALMLRTHLAEDSLLHERFDEAAERFTALVELGRRQRRDSYRMTFVLPALMMALAETGRLDEARTVVLEALPPLLHTGLHGDYAPELALVTLRCGHAAVAARLLGAGDARLARRDGRRLLIERRAYERAIALLEAEHSRARIDEWMADGAALGDGVFEQLPAILGHGGTRADA